MDYVSAGEQLPIEKTLVSSWQLVHFTERSSHFPLHPHFSSFYFFLQVYLSSS